MVKSLAKTLPQDLSQETLLATFAFTALTTSCDQLGRGACIATTFDVTYLTARQGQLMLNRIKRAKTLTCTMKVSRKNQARRPFAAARQSGASHRVYRQAQCPASRRECIAAGAALLCCPNAAHAFETDAKTVANSILSAYGLPTIKDSKGYKEYNRDVDGFTLLVPKDWIARCVRCVSLP